MTSLFYTATVHSAEPVATNASDKPAPAGSDQDVYFDPIFLGPDSNINLQRYAKGNAVTPGIYRLDLILNQTVIGRYDIKFAIPKNASANSPAQLCLSKDFLSATLGVKQSDLEKSGDTARGAKPDQQDDCQQINLLLPGASYDYDQGEQKLSLSIPQVYLQQAPRGWVPPEQWDSGITAALLDYNVNAFTTSGSQTSATSFYAGLQPGINLGEFRFRHIGNVNWSQGADSQAHYNTIATYVERDITLLKSQLRMGDVTTQGGLFQGFGLRGMSLYSDNRMLPDSQSGYAPTIRGTANSNAKVSVTQNGQLIYQTTVASGPFEINDLYPSNYSGDLQVSVQEADNTIRTFTVPYSSLPQLLRPQTQRFSISAGEYNNQDSTFTPAVAEMTYQRGITNNLTSYLGTQLTPHYQAYLLGNAFNTGFGALSLEVIHSRAAFADDSTSVGNSYRAAFSRLIDTTKTDLTLAAYRYSTAGFLSLQDATNIEQSLRQNTNANIEQQKTRFEITLNQKLPYDLGNIFVTGSSEAFWNAGRQNSYIAGYNTTLYDMTFGITYQDVRVYSVENGNATQSEPYIQLSLSMPFGGNERPKMLMMNHGQDTQGRQRSDQLGVSGSLTGSNVSYFASASQSDNRKSSSLNLGGNYTGNYGEVNATSGIGSDYRQASLGMSGGVVAYRGGIKFGPRLGSTVAIVEAPGAEGAHLVNNSSVVGKDGLALANNLLPYRLNTVSIDPVNLPVNVRLDRSVHTFAPRSGSVSLLKYQTTVGRSLMVDIDNTDVPFGAEVLDERNNLVGVVGQGKRAVILLTSTVEQPAQQRPVLRVKWGEAAGEQCTLDYTQPKQDLSVSTGFEWVSATCRAAIGQ